MLLFAAFLVWYAAGDAVSAVLRGEQDLSGRRVFRAQHPTAVEQVDLERVHAELIPAWMIQSSRRSQIDRRRAHERYVELREAVSADPNLVALVDELHTLVREDPVGNAERIYYLVWAWRRYLDDNGQPWMLTATVRLDQDGGFVYTKSYRVVADFEVPAADAQHRVRVVLRADSTNVVENYLGLHVEGEEGALVVADRIVRFATDEVWPLLDPASGHVAAPSVQAQLASVLGAGDFGVLTATAPDRAALVDSIAAARLRTECGSRMVFSDPPWNGFAPETHPSFLAAGEMGADHPCPGLTPEEAAAIVGASERLASQAGLRAALEALTATVARGVVLHEVQHAVDDAERTCSGCAELGPRARAELSAYLASLGDPDTAAVALLQACSLDVELGGSHGAAVAFLAEQMLPAGCEGPPPADLHERARALQEELYGSWVDLALPEGFPERLPLDLANGVP